MDEDERHKSSSCIITRARRLYIRDYNLVLDVLDKITPRKKQVFIPMGIICLNCGFIIGNMSGRLGRWNGWKDLRTEIPDYPELPKPKEPPHFSRQQRRRGHRLKEKRLKRLAKYGIKNRPKVITRLD